MSITSGFKKFKNHIKNGDGTYSLQSLWTSAQTVECADGTTVEDKIGGLKGISTDLETTEAGYAADMTVVGQLNRDISQCFQSVSDGKSIVASAVTDKGVTTAADATFSVIANNISNIVTSVKRLKTIPFTVGIQRFKQSSTVTISTGYTGKVLNTSIFVISNYLQCCYGTAYPTPRTNFNFSYNSSNGVVTITISSNSGEISNDGSTDLTGNIIVLG